MTFGAGNWAVNYEIASVHREVMVKDSRADHVQVHHFMMQFFPRTRETIDSQFVQSRYYPQSCHAKMIFFFHLDPIYFGNPDE